MINLSKATNAISSRGPDFQNAYTHEHVGLGHRRLSIIDTSHEGHQPMTDDTGRYVLVYNGEIYNFRELRKELVSAGITFRSESDTEVLMYLLIKEGISCLKRINGFFAFAFYDSQKDQLLIARDRIGIKPLLILHDHDKLIFASEMKAIFEFGVEKTLDLDSLALYLQLNYIPAPYSMMQNVQKLEPGCYIELNGGRVEHHRYYKLPSADDSQEFKGLDYESAKVKLAEILEQSVTDRLYADVPLGAFLSGGVDSSIISALAARHTDKLHTFSIGYRDEPFFDETAYAKKVAAHIGSEHTIFTLSNRDLFDSVYNILDYIDEPFADSSSIAVNLLSKETRQHVTVALSGDGADELFGGYNKHRALYRMLNPGRSEKMASNLGWVWDLMPHSRNSTFTNRFRQLARFSKASKLSPRDRYWMLATFQSQAKALDMLTPDSRQQLDPEKGSQAFELFTGSISNTNESLIQHLQADMRLVLPNDMLTKVDLMSMAHSLEVRVPFLDHQVVKFAMSLPDEYKVNAKLNKRILQDTFKDLLPANIYNRPKKGFEVPLLKWFRRDMKTLIWEDLLDGEFIQDQGLFNYESIKSLRKRINSSNPGDAHATVWALIVFQWWYRKYYS
jgi:asparagine synthase (glutamine-hydrolysing)